MLHSSKNITKETFTKKELIYIIYRNKQTKNDIDEIDINNMFGELVNYSLINRDNIIYSMHNLTQEILFDIMNEDNKNWCFFICNKIFKRMYDDYEKNNNLFKHMISIFLPHAIVFVEKFYIENNLNKKDIYLVL